MFLGDPDPYSTLRGMLKRTLPTPFREWHSKSNKYVKKNLKIKKLRRFWIFFCQKSTLKSRPQGMCYSHCRNGVRNSSIKTPLRQWGSYIGLGYTYAIQRPATIFFKLNKVRKYFSLVLRCNKKSRASKHRNTHTTARFHKSLSFFPIPAFGGKFHVIS